MSNDIGEAALQLVRSIRWRDPDGEFSLSPESCTTNVINFVRKHAIADDQPDARQERIDATARAIFAATFVDEEDEDASPGALRDLYPDGFEAKLAADCDAAYRFAIALESARERARAKEGK